MPLSQFIYSTQSRKAHLPIAKLCWKGSFHFRPNLGFKLLLKNKISWEELKFSPAQISFCRPYQDSHNT